MKHISSKADIDPSRRLGLMKNEDGISKQAYVCAQAPQLFKHKNLPSITMYR